MDIPSIEIIKLLYQILPGFICTWLFYSFTEHTKPTPFERVIQALIYTAIIRAFVISLEYLYHKINIWFSFNLGAWTDDVAYLNSVLVAFVLGLIVSSLNNTNKLHAHIPSWISNRTTYSSEWFSSFTREKAYVYLHLKDHRRIYGWPNEWPDRPDEGHFVLMQAEWISDENERIPLECSSRLLIPAKNVLMVEFEKPDNQLHTNTAPLAKTNKKTE